MMFNRNALPILFFNFHRASVSRKTSHWSNCSGFSKSKNRAEETVTKNKTKAHEKMVVNNSIVFQSDNTSFQRKSEWEYQFS